MKLGKMIFTVVGVVGMAMLFTACGENTAHQEFQDPTDCAGKYIVPEETELVGELPECTHLTAEKAWVLTDDFSYEFTRVSRDHVLKIDPGTTIVGELGSVLIIERGGVLLAEGRADAPIVLKAGSPSGWGGIVIQGNGGNAYDGYCYGPTYTFTNESNDGRSSGYMSHLIINDAGQKYEYDVPSQAMCFTNISGATTVENITINNAMEEGVEIFGGSVDLSNIVINGSGADGFEVYDWNGTVEGLSVAGARYAGIEIHRTGPAYFKNVTIDTAVSVKQGGIYFHGDSSAHFENVAIRHNAQDASYGALHTSALPDMANTSFTQLSITGSNPTKASGDAEDAIREAAGL